MTSNLNFTKKDVGRFAVVYGEGIENYMNDAPIHVGLKSNLSNPLKPIVGVPLPVLGVVSFLDHNWSSRFSSSIGYSLVNTTNSNARRRATTTKVITRSPIFTGLRQSPWAGNSCMVGG
jgi:hypothetical protein